MDPAGLIAAVLFLIETGLRSVIIFIFSVEIVTATWRIALLSLVALVVVPVFIYRTIRGWLRSGRHVLATLPRRV